MLPVLATPTFSRIVTKMHLTEKVLVDEAVKAIASDPHLGEEKKGDLAGTFVYKFKINKQEVLLSYQLNPDKKSPVSLLLLSIGAHENFYTDLKRSR